MQLCWNKYLKRFFKALQKFNDTCFCLVQGSSVIQIDAWLGEKSQNLGLPTKGSKLRLFGTC